MRAVARVDDDIEADTAERGVRAEAVYADVQDVDVLSREHAGDVVEHAGLVLKPRPEREVAARRHEPLLQRLAEQVRVDVPAADDDGDLLPADPAIELEDRRERGGAG